MKPPSLTDAQKLKQASRRGFIVGGIAGTVGLGLFAWLKYFAALDEGVPWPLRRILRFNEKIAGRLFSRRRLATEFDVDLAEMPRANGWHGVHEDININAWRLTVASEGGTVVVLTLADVKALPRVEMVTELKCIEGWSTIVQWAGVRLADLARFYGMGTRSGKPADPEFAPDDLLPYVAMDTGDKMEYYIGLDAESAFAPQTLLCYEMNGEPLTPAHGAPLRLAIPNKYGIKNIKQVATIRFTSERPRDYWAEQGYDWYAGH